VLSRLLEFGVGGGRFSELNYDSRQKLRIVVPAGGKAVGHIQEADRSGYVRLQFESLMMPDGATVPIQGVASDSDMRPLKGKVEGKNTGQERSGQIAFWNRPGGCAAHGTKQSEPAPD